MRELYLKITLLAMLLMSFGNYLSAQVTFDNNEQTVVGGFITPPTINNFTVPAGTDRLLVVVFSTANSSFSTTTTFPQVDFGTNTLTGGQEQVQNFNRATKTYFLPLGTGAATSNDITLSSTVSGAEFRVLTAFSLQFVNQTTPVEASVGQQPPDNGTTNSIIVPNTTNGSLIVENLLFSAGFPFVSATPQSGQNIIDSREESSGNRIRTSLVTTSGGDVTITWEIDPSINRGANTAMSFDFSGVLLNKGNEMVTTNEDIAVTTPNVLTNNVDGVNNIGIPTPPTTSSQGGTVSFNAGDSTFIYTPALNFNGQDTIIYTVCDDVMPMPNCVQDSVFITVVPQNDPPTQGNENLTLNEDDPTTATPNVLANNMDVDGDPVTVTSPPTTSSQGATISFNTADSTFNYTPIANFCGMDSIFYMVCDDSNVCMNDTVFINVICVNDPPNQGNENLTLNEDDPTTATPNVLANNMDIDGDLVTVNSPPTTSSQGATVRFNTADSTFSYTPVANFCGMDSIFYMVCDNSNVCVNDTVFINVICVNDPPNQGNENLTLNEDDPTTATPNVLANNMDIDGDPVTVTSPPTTSSQGATLSFNTADSTFSYTPVANFCGMDSIFYMVCDDSNVCVNDTVFINVICVNDPPNQGNENLTLNEDDPTTATPNVLANNMDIDGDPVTVTSPPTTSSQGAMISFNTADSTFNYTPVANFCGMDSIFYMVCDDNSACINDTVFINVVCVNDPPNQGNENLTLNEDDPTTATPNVLANNMDIDGDLVTVNSPPTTSSQGATLSFNTADSTFSYTPVANFCGMDSIFYMVCDNSNVCVNDTVFINVICVNDPPNQGNENLNIQQNDPTTATPNVLLNNTDVDGDPVVVTNHPILSTRGATVGFNVADSTFSYTPIVDFFGMDSIFYMVCDNSNVCVNDTVFVDVAMINNVPVEPIPTMGEWALIIFGLLILNLGLIFLRQLEHT